MSGPSITKQPINSRSILRFRSSSTKSEKSSILLVGSSEFCHLMSESLTAINKQNHCIKLIISKSENIEYVLQTSSSFHVDIIIFLMNTSQRHCLEQVERSICLVESVYLCERIILVNGCNHLNATDMGMTFDELFNLTEKYRLHMFNGNIKNKESCNDLARRILNFMTIVCGLKTGIPMVLDFPVDKFPID